MKKVSTNIFKVVKCCFYFFGSKPKEVKHWMQIRAAIKPALFLEKALAFEPIGPKKKRLCTRVRRILRGSCGAWGFGKGLGEWRWRPAVGGGGWAVGFRGKSKSSSQGSVSGA